MSSQNIHLYLTNEHDCGYIPGRKATNLVPDPGLEMDMVLYSQLIQLGYRRSGSHTYRPHCTECSACKPCRVPVGKFAARRRQRRCLAQNADLSFELVKAHYSDEHFELYKRYINARHADGDMANPTPSDYRNFLYCDWSETFFFEFRQDGILKAVAVTDFTYNGLSAVYSFYDPDEHRRSLGNFCILKQIEYARSHNIEHVYLGYWIPQCRKMRYKAELHPMEIFYDNRWLVRDDTD